MIIYILIIVWLNSFSYYSYLKKVAYIYKTLLCNRKKTESHSIEKFFFGLSVLMCWYKNKFLKIIKNII